MNILFWENVGLLTLLFLFPSRRAAQPTAAQANPDEASRSRGRVALGLGVVLTIVTGLWLLGQQALAVQLTLGGMRALAAQPQRTVRDVSQAIPKSALAACSLLIVLVLAGHYYRTPYRTFPFIAWKMYGVPVASDTVAIYHVRGATSEGEMVRINPPRLHPALGLGRFRLANHIKT